jgi:hypothetical protein
MISDRYDEPWHPRRRAVRLTGRLGDASDEEEVLGLLGAM